MAFQTMILSALRDFERDMKSTPTPMVRVAYKWTKRASDAVFDLMFRLSILEGAAGVAPGSWSDHPNRGLVKAMDTYGGAGLDDAWLSRKDQGVYRYLLKMAASTLRSSGIEGVSELGADEILTNSFLGLGRKSGSKKRVLYAVGKSLSDKIWEGEETPMEVAVGKAKSYIRNSVLNEIKTYRRRLDRMRIEMGEEDTAGDRGIRDEKIWNKSKGQYFADVMFDPSDRLGQTIQAWVKNFLSKQKGSKYLLTWFDKSLEAHKPVTQRVVAEDYGVAPTGLGRYFKPALRKLQAAFWKTDFAEQLEDAFFSEGGRVASDRKAIKLAIRWTVQSFFQA